jgi:hypothetical protein
MLEIRKAILNAAMQRALLYKVLGFRPSKVYSLQMVSAWTALTRFCKSQLGNASCHPYLLHFQQPSCIMHRQKGLHVHLQSLATLQAVSCMLRSPVNIHVNSA